MGQRDRRLSADGAEERAIRSVLAEKGCPAELMLFEMALESAMRLREMYTLTKITGHKDPRMLSRYANIRGSTLAVKLW